MQGSEVIDPEAADSSGRLLCSVSPSHRSNHHLFYLLCIDIFSGDVITALEYSSSGEYLATGDRNGRITVLRMDMDAKAEVRLLLYPFLFLLWLYFLQHIVFLIDREHKSPGCHTFSSNHTNRNSIS